ncbi:MAG: hypothetical protein EOO61_10495 [Hymenobacter sp.]|nr:MAG: hypothetical protein EOO61_10495 [Hymenobacter sp.]
MRVLVREHASDNYEKWYKNFVQESGWLEDLAGYGCRECVFGMYRDEVKNRQNFGNSPYVFNYAFEIADQQVLMLIRLRGHIIRPPEPPFLRSTILALG